MISDEEQIRDLVSKWQVASKTGDVQTVLALMTDDVVFLRPGCASMGKSEFAALASVPLGASPPKIEGTSEIREIQVCGDWAFMWSALSVRVTPAGSDQPIDRAGHTLTVFQKTNDTWLLARDANLLVPIAPSK